MQEFVQTPTFIYRTQNGEREREREREESEDDLLPKEAFQIWS